jgi:hypothetical protein
VCITLLFIVLVVRDASHSVKFSTREGRWATYDPDLRRVKLRDYRVTGLVDVDIVTLEILVLLEAVFQA